MPNKVNDPLSIGLIDKNSTLDQGSINYLNSMKKSSPEMYYMYWNRMNMDLKYKVDKSHAFSDAKSMSWKDLQKETSDKEILDSVWNAYSLYDKFQSDTEKATVEFYDKYNKGEISDSDLLSIAGVDSSPFKTLLKDNLSKATKVEEIKPVFLKYLDDKVDKYYNWTSKAIADEYGDVYAEHVWQNASNTRKITLDKERAFNYFYEQKKSAKELGINSYDTQKEIYNHFNDKQWKKMFAPNVYENEWSWKNGYQAKLDFDPELTEKKLNEAKKANNYSDIYSIAGKDYSFKYFKEMNIGEKELTRKLHISYIKEYRDQLSGEERQRLFPKYYETEWSSNDYGRMKALDPQRLQKEIFDPAPYSRKKELNAEDALNWLSQQPEKYRNFHHPDDALELKNRDYNKSNPNADENAKATAKAAAISEIEKSNFQSLKDMKAGTEILADQFSAMRSHTLIGFNSKEYADMKTAYQKFAKAYDNVMTGKHPDGKPLDTPEALSNKDKDTLEALKNDMSKKAQLYIDAKRKQKGDGISAHWTGQGADRLAFADALVSFKFDPQISSELKSQKLETKDSKGKVTSTNLGELMKGSERGRKNLDYHIENMKKVEARNKQKKNDNQKAKQLSDGKQNSVKKHKK